MPSSGGFTKILVKAYNTTSSRGSREVSALLMFTRVVTKISRFRMIEPRLLRVIGDELRCSSPLVEADAQIGIFPNVPATVVPHQRPCLVQIQNRRYTPAVSYTYLFRGIILEMNPE